MALRQSKPTPTKKKNPLPVIIILVVVLMVGGAAAYSFLVGNNTEQSEDASETEQVEDVSLLTDEQKKIRDSYSVDVKNALKILQESHWTNGKQVDSLTFGDASYTETSENGSTNKEYFVICATKSETEKPSNSGQITVTTITCMDRDNKYFYLKLSEVTDTNKNKSYVVESDRFKKNGVYTQVGADDELKIQIGNDLAKTIPFDQSALKTEVSNYIKEKYPSTTEVIFYDTLTINFSPFKSYVLVAKCNNTAKTMLDVAYNADENSFSISKSAGTTSTTNQNQK